MLDTTASQGFSRFWRKPTQFLSRFSVEAGLASCWGKQTVLWTLFLFTSIAAAQSLVCRRPGISGMESNAHRAHGFLPPNTSDVRKMAIYVENTPDGVYFHSNFVTAGAENPTKILTKQKTDLKLIFENLVFTEKPAYEEGSQALEAYTSDVRVYLDRSMFSEGGYPKIDVKDVGHVAIIDGKQGQILADDVEKFSRTSPPPVLMGKISGCCMFGIPPHLAGQYQRALEARALQRKNIKFVSLVRDSGTENMIAKSANLSAVRLGNVEAPISSLADIDAAFRSARGSTIVLVSHVEGQNFVIRGSGGNVLSSLPISSVRDLAAKHNIELIDLGCETAQSLSAERLGIGVTNKFNTVAAVKALENALGNSRNYAEFFNTLTADNLRVVIDEGFTRGWPLCADIYSKGDRGNVWVKLARVFVSFQPSRPS